MQLDFRSSAARLEQVKEAAVQRAPAGEYEELSVPQGQLDGEK